MASGKSVAIAKAYAWCSRKPRKNRKKFCRNKRNNYATIREFGERNIGRQVEIGTIAGTIVGTLVAVERNYFRVVDGTGNLVLIPFANIVFVENL